MKLRRMICLALALACMGGALAEEPATPEMQEKPAMENGEFGGRGERPDGMGEKPEGMGERPDGMGRGGMGGGQGGVTVESHYAEAEAKFTQHEYTDPETGLTIPYNLFLPEGYDGETEYPLVIDIADAGVNSNEVTDVIRQDGAAVWATDAEQKKHPCIVLAPQYTLDLVSSIGMLTEDDYQWSEGLTLVSKLIFSFIDEYAVDVSRIYGTGQSQGGMTTIAMSDKYPDLYAAQLLVACQWDVEEMSAMVDDKLWIVVCEGDTKAYPGMNAATENWVQLGAQVATSEMWDGEADAAEMAARVAEMEAQGCDINYTVLSGGSHTYTWTVAYTIEGIRDWLFAQTK